MMTRNESRVDQVMNSAIEYLKASNIEVTPENHLALCQCWLESLMDSTDPIGIETFDALGIACDRIRSSILKFPKL